jgi:hypothetical protein
MMYGSIRKRRGLVRRAGVPLLSLGAFLVLAAGGGVLAGLARPPAVRAPRDSDPLPMILEKTKAYCQRLANASLDFICRERIDEREFSPPLRLFSTMATPGRRRVTSISLEYDYQLVRNGGTIDEKRVLLRENKEPRNEPNAVLKTKLYKHKYLVYGPVGLLGEAWQPKHTYAYLGEESVEREKAYLIEATPWGPAETNLIYGKVWVREKDFAVVKIEWDQRSLGNYEKVLQMAKAVGPQAEPRISIVGYYGVEKNGIRFPDRLTIREDYESGGGLFRASETTVLYKDYHFFIVETEVRY